ncbi:MAG TPA: PQQ-binding-like beta-propeller repeat protein [Symbiobacteriaceae bacterium]|nr:PQQ-binding-like beta-propeller repeat protein [Symbiobacteriaceae bacterium]
MRAFTVLAFAAALLLLPAPAFAEPATASPAFSLPNGYGAYHPQDFTYPISAGAGPLRLAATHYEYGYVPLFAVALADPVRREILGQATLTTAEPQAELDVPAAGAYEIIVRPLFEQWETYTNPRLEITAEGLQMASRETNCIAVHDFVDYSLITAAQFLDMSPCAPQRSFISHIAINGQVLYESDTPDGGRTHRLEIDPAAVPDGIYFLDVSARENQSQNRSRTQRSFMIDQQDQYLDVPQSHWARHPVELMSHLGILSGRGEGLFAPDEPVLRKEFAKMVALTFDLPAGGRGAIPFADAPGDWSQPYIDALSEAGLAQGETVDGVRFFRPDRPISRAEAVTIIGRALKVADDDVSVLPPLYIDQAEIPDWALPSVGVLSLWRWISGFPDGAFHPFAQLQRAQAAKILAHELGLEPSDQDSGGPRPPGLSSGWTHQFGDAGRRSHHPGASTGAAAEPLWASAVKPDGFGNTVLGNGLIFTAGARGRVYALLPGTGEVLWMTEVAPPFRIGHTLAYSSAHNLLFAAATGEGTGQVTALNPATGRKVWTANIPGSLDRVSPVVASNLVIVAGSSSNLYALAAETGAVVWSHSSGGSSAPTVAGDRIFVANYNGQAYAYRLSDGAPLWQRHNGWSGNTPPPVAGHGLLFVASDYSDRLYALDQATGDVVWEVPGKGRVAVDDRHVWALQPDGGLAVLNPATGETVATVGGCGQTPVIGATHAYISCNGTILAIDRTTFAVQPLAPGGQVVAMEADRLYFLLNDPSPWDRYLLAAMTVR